MNAIIKRKNHFVIKLNLFPAETEVAYKETGCRIRDQKKQHDNLLLLLVILPDDGHSVGISVCFKKKYMSKSDQP